MPTRGIAVKLNREGIPAPRGGVWVPIKINGILKCKAYTGRFVFNNTEVNMPELRLIDDQIFAMAQDRFARNKRLGKRNRKHDHHYGHINAIVAAMSGAHTASRRKSHPYYHCK